MFGEEKWDNQSCFKVVWEPMAQGRKKNEEKRKASVEKNVNSKEDGLYNLIMIQNSTQNP